MKNRLITVIALLCFAFLSQAQVGIPHVGSTDNSAELKVEAQAGTKRGTLFPVLTSTQVYAIQTPATGLMVFDVSDNFLKYFNGTQWQKINVTPSYTANPAVASSVEGQVVFNTSNGLLYVLYSGAWHNYVRSGKTLP